MDYHALYPDWCKNVRMIETDVQQIKRLLNHALRVNDIPKMKDTTWAELKKMPWTEVKDCIRPESETLTRAYALLYSIYAEAVFYKTIYTPHGFSNSEIERICRKHSLEDKWRDCLDSCFQRIMSDTNRKEVCNKKQYLLRIFSEYVKGPLQMRNKLAHGQPVVCFNKHNTAVNSDFTERLAGLNCEDVDRNFEVYQTFAKCVEDLIESPHKAHFRDYYSDKAALDACIAKHKKQTMMKKIEALRRKPIHN